MKTQKNKLLIAGGLATFSLFIIGFFFMGSLMIYATQTTLSHKAIFLSPAEPLQFRFYMGMLLVLCLPVAILLSWVKTKSKESISLLTVITYLFIPLLSAFIGMWLRLMEIKIYVVEPIITEAIVPDFKLAFPSIDYFESGIISILVVCIPVMYILYRRERRNKNKLSYNKQKEYKHER